MINIAITNSVLAIAAIWFGSLSVNNSPVGTPAIKSAPINNLKTEAAFSRINAVKIPSTCAFLLPD